MRQMHLVLPQATRQWLELEARSTPSEACPSDLPPPQPLTALQPPHSTTHWACALQTGACWRHFILRLSQL